MAGTFSEVLMQKSHLLLLLRLVHAKADVEALLRQGLRFSQIASLISDTIEKGYILLIDGELTLTEEGMSKLKTDTITVRYRTDGGWISPAEEFRIRPQRYDKVYLPELRKSFFETREAD